jgi:chorismate lyase / 3-hydroxybenzoate synthase
VFQGVLAPRLTTRLVPEHTSSTSSGDRHVLGVVRYGAHRVAPSPEPGAPVELRVHMEDGDHCQELWETDRPVIVGERNSLRFSHDGDHLFCAGVIPHGDAYTDLVRDAYVRSFELAAHLGYPHIFRLWNFIAGINSTNASGLETYRDFCRGRAEAFTSYPDIVMPAATGIGATSGGIVFYFLASRDQRWTALENPRQQAAYQYPEKYGPRSPSFARGTFLRTDEPDPAGTDGQLFVSGTASIIGHDTVHRDDLARQCEVTFENIELLMSAENLARYGIERGCSLADLTAVKAYVRRPADVEQVRSRCAEVLSPKAQLVVLVADICRSDLLVEIEGVAANGPLGRS